VRASDERPLDAVPLGLKKLACAIQVHRGIVRSPAAEDVAAHAR
jgi:hypothetical protein